MSQVIVMCSLGWELLIQLLHPLHPNNKYSLIRWASWELSVSGGNQDDTFDEWQKAVGLWRSGEVCCSWISKKGAGYFEKNVASSLKYTGESILKALTFKGMTPFHSYREKKLQNRDYNFVLVEVYRNIVTWPTWTAARTKDSNMKFAKATLLFPHFAFKNALLKPFEEFRIWGAWAPRSPCLALQ